MVGDYCAAKELLTLTDDFRSHYEQEEEEKEEALYAG